jgi:hypothetical protein
MISRLISLLLLLLMPAWGWSQQKCWIFFRDKGFSGMERAQLMEQEKASLPQHVLERRAKMLPKDQVVTEDDLPLFQPYLKQLQTLGVTPIVQSRWLNAISAVLSQPQLDAVAALPFVKAVSAVARFAHRLPPEEVEKSIAKNQTYLFDYGASLTQNAIMHVPEVHELGLDGGGVVVGMLDTGFDYKYHEAFSRLKVKAEYDFINQDSVTTNEDKNKDALDQHNHGTYTLSAIGGFTAGQLIGPAFGASYLLAKTEVVPSETPIEEDYWVAGLEWLERQGADVVNSSLGYLDWYQYENMDGKTAVTTLMADKAVLKGVVVVNSMGNEGNSAWRYMIAPADGFHVIAVGAVYSTGELVSFSSRGPTYDGRTKPDVVAMGAGVHVAEASTFDKYRKIGGTSLSSPLTAGVAALILQAHPYLTPFEVRDALRNTADRAQNPDNDYGWGLVNAYEAIFYHGLFFSRLPIITPDAGNGYQIKIKIFSKYELQANELWLYYAVADNNFSQLLLTATGEPHEYEAVIPLSVGNAEIKFYFSAMDASGDQKNHPFKAPAAYFQFSTAETTVTPVNPPTVFRLYQNYPNPFDRFTTIQYDIVAAGKVSLVIFNLRGEQVRKLIDDEFHFPSDTSYRRSWDGRNDQGKMVASGIYFYRIQSGATSAIKRMVFLQGKAR